MPGSGGLDQATVDAKREAPKPNVEEPSDAGDDALLVEAAVDRNPQEDAKGKPELVQAAPADMPEPIQKNSKMWYEAEKYAFSMLDVVNKVRKEHEESWVDPAHFKLVRAWQSVEEGLAFKLCTEMYVDSEKTWALIDATTEDGAAALTSVTPALRVLGKKAFYEANSELSDGEQVEEDTTNLNEFPCNGDVALIMETVEKSGFQTGLMRSGSSSLLGRRSRKAPTDFPKSYDAREAFPDCALPVQDQGGCGSCYAFAAAAVAGERLCIKRLQTGQTALLAFEKRFDSTLEKEAKQKASSDKFLQSRLLSFRAKETANTTKAGEVMSQQELVSCGSSDQPMYETPYCLKGPGGVNIKKWSNGCEGGTPLNAFYFIHTYGLPTKSCVPYVSGGGGDYKDHFDLQAGKVPICSKLEELPCHKERAQNRMGRPIRCPNGDIACIMDAIYQKGPVFASISAESGLMNDYGKNAYTDGVYVKKADEMHMGHHAVVLYGWGTSESGIDYWIGRNSWGDNWGQDGMFKIRRGTNEVGVEDEIYFAAANPNESPDVNGDCVKVEQQGSNCLLVNTCESEIRAVTVNYLGDSKAENCGSWTSSISSVLPGNTNAVTLNDAHSCTVLEDTFVRDYDNGRYYQDVTDTYRQYGYTCVLQNTWTGATPRHVCCGGLCAGSGPGLAVFPNEFCDEFCPQGTSEQ